MPKATKASDSATTKKRSRKTSPENGKGTQAAESVTTSPEFAQESQSSPVLEERVRARAYGKGTQAAELVTTSPEFAQESQSSPTLEEKIRARAHELYLLRDGTGGSPEQDWLQAQREICGDQRTG